MREIQLQSSLAAVLPLASIAFLLPLPIKEDVLQHLIRHRRFFLLSSGCERSAAVRHKKMRACYTGAACRTVEHFPDFKLYFPQRTKKVHFLSN